MATGSPDFDNSYARLPERFFARVPPSPASEPQLIRVNTALAAELGLDPDWLASTEGIAMVAGNLVPTGADPIATAYAGHQFGSWNPQLGDGRALLLGEVINPEGERFDIQLKGSGRTPYSRGGDGKAPLGPVLREYIVSEAMATLGIPTTRTLSAVTTGDTVYRDGALPGGVLARVARSHIRIGTMQFFAARKDAEAVRLLADHVIQRHYPDVASADNPYLALFEAIVGRQARLVARWQLVGFIHGVMNTDNMLLSGETIDYGPCAFMDDFDPATVFSSIDQGGRYAYRNQPGIAQWNLMCLAQAMLPLFADEQDKAVTAVNEILASFVDRFAFEHQQELNRKLGIAHDSPEVQQLGTELFALMAEEKTDFTLTFRRLAEIANPADPAATEASIQHIFDFPAAFSSWLDRWQKMVQADNAATTTQRAAMLQANPVFIARNHLIEAVIVAAVQQSDFDPFHQLVDVLEKPFEFVAGMDRYATPPSPEQIVPATFCGT